MDEPISPFAATLTQVEQALTRQLQGILINGAKALNGDDACNARHGLDALHHKIQTLHDNTFAFLARNLERRAANQRKFGQYDYAVVSLGIDCLPRTFATRWGFKPPKSLGEPSHPFDLAVHPSEAVCAILETGFGNYLSAPELAVGGRDYVIHKALKVQFNHEIGPEFHGDGFAGFIARYQRRVENFRRSLAAGPVLFIHHVNDHAAPTRLVGALERITPRSDWHLLVVNTSPTGFNDAAHAQVGRRATLAHHPYPYQGYIWHLPGHYTTAEGRAFEDRLERTIANVILRHFSLRQPSRAA